MGLDATVFRNVRDLERVAGQGRFDVDAATGEATPTAGLSVDLPDSAYIAADERLGNLAQVTHLREIAEGLLSADSLLVRQVLYSGSHCGDCIALDELPQLKRELNVLRSQQHADVVAFVAVMLALVNAAETELNPIVFT